MPQRAYTPSMSKHDLKVWRVRHGLTQAELAEAIGVARITLQGWERGRSPLPAWLENALIGVGETLEERP